MHSESASEARIIVEGQDADLESLRTWLRREPELRGKVRTVTGPVPTEAMGALAELAVALAATAPIATALARSIPPWLSQRTIGRTADLTVTVTGPDGRKVSLSAKRVADPESLLREVLESPDTPSAPDEAGTENDR
ncbi:effector-associated constant component EACC1 [Nocardia lijiangensis]|uniref:effector-associated constant component EACC1 n=1 Tax=Nocardia lijiangensis TaxID=299618 RepID=UPI000A57DD7E